MHNNIKIWYSLNQFERIGTTITKELIVVLCFYYNINNRPIVDKKSKNYKTNLILNDRLKEIMVGLLLGDGNMQTFSKTGKTWRFRLLQGGENHFEYINHLRNVFNDWTVMPITEYNEKSKIGKLYKNWYFNTLSFEQFAEIGNAFYKQDNEKGKWRKVIPIEITNWISDLSLAY